MRTLLIVDANSIGRAAFEGLPFDPEEEERAVRGTLSFVSGEGIKYQISDLLFVFTQPGKKSYDRYRKVLFSGVEEAGIATAKVPREQLLHQLADYIAGYADPVLLLSDDPTWQSLVTEDHIQLLLPLVSKEEGCRVMRKDQNGLKEELGYGMDRMPEVIALSHVLGDAMAGRLMREHGSLSTILLMSDEIKEKNPRTWQLLMEKRDQILSEALFLSPERGKVESGVVKPLLVSGDTQLEPSLLAELAEGAVTAKKQPGEDALYVDSLQKVHMVEESFEALFAKKKGCLGVELYCEKDRPQAFVLSADEVTAVYDLGAKDLSAAVLRLLKEARQKGWTLGIWDIKAMLHRLGHMAGREYDILATEEISDGMHQEASGQLSLFDLAEEDAAVDDRGAGELLDYLCGLEQAVFDAGKADYKTGEHGFEMGDYGRRLSEVYCDVSLLAYLLDPLSTGKDFGIEKASFLHLKREFKDYKSCFGKKSFRESLDTAREEFVAWAGSRGALLATLSHVLGKALQEDGQYRLYEELELPLVFALYSMEKEGVAMDPKELSTYGRELSEGIEELQKQIYEEAGEAFNINSPKQLGSILFEKLGLPAGKKTKSGYSTAADVLEKLAADYPVVEHILSYRTLSKLKSTYADGLLGCVAADGRVHTTFQQTVTATGRLSSTDPNLQNIPIRMELGKRIRRVFHAKEGCVFLDADYSQIELRVLAHLSGDEKLVEAYRQNRDIHQATAALVFHVPFEEVSPMQRRAAKAVNFGIVYGISSFGLGNNLDISRQQAQQYIDDYFAAYPGLHAYLDELVASAKRDHVALTMFGRRRPMPELSSGAYMQRQFGERVAMNAPIQGSAADIIKIAMLHVWQRLRKEELGSRLLLQVHDELLIETKVEEKDLVKKILDEEMHHAADLLVPLEIDLEEGYNWYDAH